jgi:hypothetical protein
VPLEPAAIETGDRRLVLQEFEFDSDSDYGIEAIVSGSSMQSNNYPSQHMFRLPDHDDAVLRPFLPGAGYTAE